MIFSNTYKEAYNVERRKETRKLEKKTEETQLLLYEFNKKYFNKFVYNFK